MIIALVILCVLATMLIAGTAQGRTAVRTMLFIPQVLPGIPIKPQEWVTQEPIRFDIKIPLSDGEAIADLYVPGAKGSYPAVLFFMGVVPPNRDDTRIVNLAEGLARAGIVVMIPWLETQEKNKIISSDINDLVLAFLHLQTFDYVDPNRMGMSGICTGASMVTVAAYDERISDRVKFVNFFAGYYDGLDLIKSIGSRSRFTDKYVAAWQPDDLTLDLFVKHLIDGLDLESDKEVLSRYVVEEGTMHDVDQKSLSQQGVAVYRLAKGVDFDEVDDVISQLSPQTLGFLRSISPSTQYGKLQARMLIMHDRGDRLVPSEESRRFAQMLDPDNNTYFTEFSFFQNEIQVHKNSNTGVGTLGYIREALKLYLHMYNIMREMD